MLIEMVDSKNPKKVIRVSPGDVDRFKEEGFEVKGEEKPKLNKPASDSKKASSAK
tara:strand:+ start:393 stop:557 length:165 start_codon:yes stop_codon:yes gene_type:complete